jgi:outer membrane protein OmpA-like peptidoglycan-associated protein
MSNNFSGKRIIVGIFLLLPILFLTVQSPGQNRLNSRLFYSKPPLYNSKSKVTHFDLSAYEVTVSLPVDNRNKFYGEVVYKNVKTHELEEFFESSTMVEIQHKINSDIKKFKSRHRSAQSKLLISPAVEVFYPKVHGFIKGKSFAKVRLEITTTLNDRLIFQKKYESLYVTNGLDNEFEGEITMTIEQGENVTVGMALRKVLDQYYADLNRVLSLGKDQVILSGITLDSKTRTGVPGEISFKLDSVVSTTSSPDGRFELTLKKRQYQTLVTASNFMNYSEQTDLASSELIMVERTFNLKPIEKGTVVNLKNVLFYMGTTNLLESSYPELDEVVIFLKNNPRVKIELNGHTDNQGSAQKDLVLSQERVDKIRTYLISKGVASRRITGKGFGGTKPIVSNATEDGRSKNRRVEFVILKN